MLNFTNRRRMARDVARAGAAVSAAMLVLTSLSALGGNPSVSAAPVGATLQMITPQGGVLTSGTSSTAFTFRLPGGAACSGDSATGGFHVDSYLIPGAVSPSAIKFDFTGPVLPAGTTGYMQSVSSGGTAFLDAFTAVTTGAVLLPTTPFDFTDMVFNAAQVTAGDYNVGLACWDTKLNVMDKYWNVVVNFTKPTASTLAFTVAAPSTAPTTTTTTTAPGATTTTVRSTTTTSTTTTAVRSTTSTTTAVASAAGSGSGGSGSTGSGSGTLVSTGSASLPLVLWAILLLFFGRVAILLSRPVAIVGRETR